MSTVSLGPELEQVVEARVARGDYPNAQALVESAIWQLLQNEEADEDLERLRKEIAIADAEIERGEFIELDVNDLPSFAQKIKDRGLQSLNSRPDEA